MKTDTRANILRYITKQGQASPHQLRQHFGLTGAAIHRQLRKLEADESIIKIGSPPRVFYRARQNSRQLPALSTLPTSIAEVIESRYVYINPDGVLLNGVEGFAHWVEKTGQQANVHSLANEYVSARTEADQWYQGKSWIEATSKLGKTFGDRLVDQVAYADFYALPKFGKTKLGVYTLHAKLSQNQTFIQSLAETIQPIIGQLINAWRIQAVAYIPHSIPRKIPLLPEIARTLQLSLPAVSVEKLYAGAVRVPQKSLSKLSERVENAQQTLYVTGEVPWKRVLLIDDAVGSGATFHEVGKKLKDQFGVEYVGGFAIVGSYKGFDVISEV